MLQVFYYAQGQYLALEPSSLPANVVCCGVPRSTSLISTSPLNLIGYAHAVAAAETAFRAHFPGLKWLSELEEGDGGGGNRPNDDDAIDDLEAALGNLGPG
jgi:hypothetical protein